MDQNLLLAVAAATLLVLLATMWLRGRGQTRTSEPRAADNLDTLSSWEPQATRVLTGPERRALLALHHALPEHFILAQVPLARFIRVPQRRSYTEWLRRVGQLSPDLIVCDAQSKIIAAIEIRPPEAQSSPRSTARLERMRKVLKAAEIPLHVWPDTALPRPEAIREVILSGVPMRTVPMPLDPLSPVIASSPSRSTPLERMTAATNAGDLATSLPIASRSTIPPTALYDEEEPEPDEVIEMFEPMSSTWFDEFDTRPANNLNPLPAHSGGIRPR